MRDPPPPLFFPLDYTRVTIQTVWSIHIRPSLITVSEQTLHSPCEQYNRDCCVSFLYDSTDCTESVRTAELSKQ